jgi:RNA polymerase sigma factor (sigma-70 family)
MSSPSDLVRLFQQLGAGSEDAARELVDKYSEPIRHVIRRHLHRVARPATDSADLTQQVWVSVLRRDLSPALLGSSEALLAFLCGLARNKALVASRHHRAQKRDRGREVSLDDPQFEQGGKLHDPRPGPEEEAERRDQWESMLGELEPWEAQALDLLRRGHAVREVSARLGISVRTVSRVVHRARERACARQA